MQSVKVKIEKASDSDWDRIANQCEYTTYFQSREWAEIWQIHTKGKVKSVPRLLTFSDGTEVLIPLSCYKVSGGLITQYISSPGWMYGGWLSAKPLSPAQIEIVWNYLHDYNLILRQNSFDPNFNSMGVGLAELSSTQALDLKPNFEALYKRWTKNSGPFLRNVKQARKANLTVQLAATLEDWKQYYAAYEDSIQRWGDSFEGPKYEWELFEFLYNRKSPNIKLWVSKYENKIISGSVCLYQNKVVHGWHVASLADYFPMRPVQLLMYSIVEDCCEKGYEWFDMGPSGRSMGVEDYKARMGCTKLDFNVFINKRFDLKTVEFVKNLGSTNKQPKISPNVPASITQP